MSNGEGKTMIPDKESIFADQSIEVVIIDRIKSKEFLRDYSSLSLGISFLDEDLSMTKNHERTVEKESYDLYKHDINSFFNNFIIEILEILDGHERAKNRKLCRFELSLSYDIRYDFHSQKETRSFNFSIDFNEKSITEKLKR